MKCFIKKKIASCLFIIIAAISVHAEVVTVSSKSDFENFFFKERTNEQSDTIYVKSNDILSLRNGKEMPQAGKIHIIGINNEETGVKSGLSFQWNLPINTASDKLSVFFENLKIECNGGRMASSKYMFQIKDTMYHYIDTLSFVNCEITNYNRALFRVQPSAKADGTRDAGDVNYMGVERCKIYEGYLAANNPMSLFRMDMRVSEMVFRNNLFYDLGYVHSLVQFATMTEEVGRENINFTCENNLFVGWNSQSSLMFFDQYVGQVSEFHINNNLFIAPDWKDDFNNADIADSIVIANPDTLKNRPQHYIASIQYGQVECKNNVLVGYNTPKESLDTEGQGAWLVADTAYFTPGELGYDKSIFVDFANRDFRYLSTQQMATAGSDGGPIGPKQMVLNYINPCNLTVSSTTEGVSFKPAKNVYEKGTEVSVTAIERPGAVFSHWENNGTDIGANNPIVFTIDKDMELEGVFEELSVAAVNITLDAPSPIEMSFSPQRDVYYKGDTVTVTFNTHYWADFDKWSDGVTEMNRTFILTDDLNTTAAFNKSDRIAVWDFDQITMGKQTMENGIGANHFVNGDSAYIGSFHTAYYVDGLGYKDLATIMTRNNKFSGDIRICAVRETPPARFAANPDYNYAIINTTDYKGIKVTSFVGADAKAHRTQLLQYSLDGQAWETVASTVLDTIGEWYSLDGNLPVAADNKDRVFIRWIGDVTSPTIAHPDNIYRLDEISEFCCVAGIVVKELEEAGQPEDVLFYDSGPIAPIGILPNAPDTFIFNAPGTPVRFILTEGVSYKDTFSTWGRGIDSSCVEAMGWTGYSYTPSSTKVSCILLSEKEKAPYVYSKLQWKRNLDGCDSIKDKYRWWYNEWATNYCRPSDSIIVRIPANCDSIFIQGGGSNIGYGLIAYQKDLGFDKGFYNGGNWGMSFNNIGFRLEPNGVDSIDIVILGAHKDWFCSLESTPWTDLESIQFQQIPLATSLVNYHESERWGQFSTVGINRIQVFNTSSTKQEEEIMKGDVNGDGKINAGDFVGLVNLILDNGYTAGLSRKAADVNEDSFVDVGDCVGLTNYILYGYFQQPSNVAALSSYNGGESTSVKVSADDFSVTAGEIYDLAVSFSDMEKYTAMQMDVVIPEGLSFVTDARGRANVRWASDQTHSLASAMQKDGSLRLLGYSNDNTLFNKADNAGIILKVRAAETVESGTARIQLRGVQVVGTDAQPVSVENSYATVTFNAPTGLENVLQEASERVIYNVLGQRVSDGQLAPGIYIINGRKVVVRKVQ